MPITVIRRTSGTRTRDLFAQRLGSAWWWACHHALPNLDGDRCGGYATGERSFPLKKSGSSLRFRPMGWVKKSFLIRVAPSLESDVEGESSLKASATQVGRRFVFRDEEGKGAGATWARRRRR